MSEQSQSEFEHRFEVSSSENSERLDSYLVKQFPNFSRVKLQRAIAAGHVLVDRSRAKSSTRLKSGQVVEARALKPETEAAVAEQIDLDILYEDDWLVAINKPPAMVVHPAKGHWSGTLTAGLAWHFEQLSTVNGPARPGIVHRLDRDTSGVILIAKSDPAHLKLAQQFEQRTIEKEYFAIVTPAPNRDRDQIDQPIGAHPYQREKKAVRIGHATSKTASTFYEVVERFQGFASVRVKPKTGRTHQIRVHMAYSGSPILCDKLYSGRASLSMLDFTRRVEDNQVLLDRQALHARRIAFSHPESGQRIEIEAKLPEDIQRTLDVLRELRS